MKAVLYVRKSTDNRQVYSLEAQKKSLYDFTAANGYEVIDCIEEVASGSDDDRKGLQMAMDLAAQHSATLIVLRIDRLGRKLSKLAQLLEQKQVPIVCAETGEGVSPVVLGMLAVVSDYERQLISVRTKAGLERAKARGVVLGNPNIQSMSEKGAAATKALADKSARAWGPILETLFSSSGETWSGLARKLNEMGMKSPRGKKWSRQTCKATLERWRSLNEEN